MLDSLMLAAGCGLLLSAGFSFYSARRAGAGTASPEVARLIRRGSMLTGCGTVVYAAAILYDRLGPGWNAGFFLGALAFIVLVLAGSRQHFRARQLQAREAGGRAP